MSKWDKWDNWIESMPKNKANKIIEEIIRDMDDMCLSNLEGPHYCNQDGAYVGLETVSQPAYDPYVRFSWEPSIAVIYHPKTDTFRQIRFSTHTVSEFKDGCIYTSISRNDISTIIAEEVFNKRTPSVYKKKEAGHWKTFAFPLVKSAFPQLLSQNLVSVQPMTAPTSMTFYVNALKKPL